MALIFLTLIKGLSGKGAGTTPIVLSSPDEVDAQGRLTEVGYQRVMTEAQQFVDRHPRHFASVEWWREHRTTIRADGIKNPITAFPAVIGETMVRTAPTDIPAKYVGNTGTEDTAEWTILDIREKDNHFENWYENLCISGNVIAVCANTVLAEFEGDDSDIPETIDGEAVVGLERGYLLGQLAVVDDQQVSLGDLDLDNIMSSLAEIGWELSERAEFAIENYITTAVTPSLRQGQALEATSESLTIPPDIQKLAQDAKKSPEALVTLENKLTQTFDEDGLLPWLESIETFVGVAIVLEELASFRFADEEACDNLEIANSGDLTDEDRVTHACSVIKENMDDPEGDAKRCVLLYSFGELRLGCTAKSIGPSWKHIWHGCFRDVEEFKAQLRKDGFLLNEDPPLASEAVLKLWNR